MNICMWDAGESLQLPSIMFYDFLFFILLRLDELLVESRSNKKKLISAFYAYRYMFRMRKLKHKFKSNLNEHESPNAYLFPFISASNLITYVSHRSSQTVASWVWEITRTWNYSPLRGIQLSAFWQDKIT